MNATNPLGGSWGGCSTCVATGRAAGGRSGRGAAPAGSMRIAAAVPAARASAPRTASGRGSVPGSLLCRDMGNPVWSIGYESSLRLNASKHSRRGAALFPVHVRCVRIMWS
ncbi:hypothetical protein GCM10020001_016540 [Nonomuraea salmonea]